VSTPSTATLDARQARLHHVDPVQAHPLGALLPVVVVPGAWEVFRTSTVSQGLGSGTRRAGTCSCRDHGKQADSSSSSSSSSHANHFSTCSHHAVRRPPAPSAHLNSMVSRSHTELPPQPLNWLGSLMTPLGEAPVNAGRYTR